MHPTIQRLHSQTYIYHIHPKYLKEIRNNLLEISHASQHVEKILSHRFWASKKYADGKYQIGFSIDKALNKPNLKVSFITPYTSERSIQNSTELFISLIKREHLQWLKKPTLCGITIESSFSGLIFPQTLLLKSGRDYYPQDDSDFSPHSLKYPRHSYSAYITEGLEKHDKKTTIRSTIKQETIAINDFTRDAFKTFNSFDFHLVNLNHLVWGRSHIGRSYRRGLLSSTTSEETKIALLTALEDTKHFDPKVKSLSQWKRLFKPQNKLQIYLSNISG